MNERQSDPTGAFSRGGAAGTEETEETEFERHAPDGSQPGGGQPNSGRPATEDARDATSGVDESERELVTGGTAATSEIADDEAQSNAERRGDGTPLPR